MTNPIRRRPPVTNPAPENKTSEQNLQAAIGPGTSDLQAIPPKDKYPAPVIKEQTPAEEPPGLLTPVEEDGMWIQPWSGESGTFPDLDAAEVAPVELAGSYWTPTIIGEKKRVLFDSIKLCEMVDQKSGAVYDLPTAFFYEKSNGQWQSIRNASSRLIACLENNHVEHYAMLEIVYQGKRKNSTNAFLSDSWSVKPLIIRQK